MKVKFTMIPYGGKAWNEAVKLREDTLRVPLGQKFSHQELKEEKAHFHIVAYRNKSIVATAVLVPEGSQYLKMQRVVVQSKLRNQSIGSQMMEFCESYASKNRYSLIYCHARDSAVNFYKRNHYQTEGAYFMEDGIPHLKMTKALPISRSEILHEDN